MERPLNQTLQKSSFDHVELPVPHPVCNLAHWASEQLVNLMLPSKWRNRLLERHLSVVLFSNVGMAHRTVEAPLALANISFASPNGHTAAQEPASGLIASSF